MTYKNQFGNSRREFLKKSSLLGLGLALGTNASIMGTPQPGGLSVATFDIDATPPVGSLLAYDPMENAWDLGLRAKGIVLTGAGKPVVLCAIDWIGIANKGQDVFKQTLADAAGTIPQNVMVHTLHQHDAPICDFSAEEALKKAGLNPQSFDSSFVRQLLAQLKKAVEESVKHLQPVTHLGTGKAPVYQVASNRRIVNDDGKVGTMRGTACKDPELRSKPEGLIDPDVTLISLWNQGKPLVVMTFYATHPQSYYLTKVANPDFPGIARFYRQLAIPDALHVHFNGAGGNIGAGKYNDGSHENRVILAERLADGMKRAWESMVKTPLASGSTALNTVPVLLPPASEMIGQIKNKINEADMRFLTNNMPKLEWLKRRQSGVPIDIACLKLGKSRILFMPGELFVEYQLAAKSFRPDLAISMAAYGDYGPFYIGTKETYQQGGYEIVSSPVTAESEEILMNAIRNLLSL